MRSVQLVTSIQNQYQTVAGAVQNSFTAELEIPIGIPIDFGGFH